MVGDMFSLSRKPQVFTLEPKQYTFKAKILKPVALQVKGDEREDIRMKAVQLPVIINNATTGHKLQGSGVDNVFVHTWSYATNWAYVMLSRVKTKKVFSCENHFLKTFGTMQCHQH